MFRGIDFNEEVLCLPSTPYLLCFRVFSAQFHLKRTNLLIVFCCLLSMDMLSHPLWYADNYGLCLSQIATEEQIY